MGMNIKVRVADILKFILLYSVVLNFLCFTFAIPSLFLYANDFFLLVSWVTCIIKKRTVVSTFVPMLVTVLAGMFFLLTTLSFLYNFSSPLYYFWGLRNTGRFFLYFFVASSVLTKNDVYDLFNLLLKALPINVVLCTIQYMLVLRTGNAEMKQFIGDYVGGMFGSYKGCNRILNIYIIFVLAYYLASFLKNELSIRALIWNVLTCAYISVLSELKVVAFEAFVVAVLLIRIILKKRNWFLVLTMSLLGILLIINLWGMLSPTTIMPLLSIEAFIEYTSASSYGLNSLNRLTVLPYIYERFFENNPIQFMIGIGLGNADYSGFAFLTTPVYERYGYLKYHYFMHGMLFLETGFIGIVLYVSFFVAYFLTMVKKLAKRPNTTAIEYAGVVFSAIAILCVFYNTTLRSEVSCYLAAFFMAVPIICSNRETEKPSGQRNRRQRVSF